MMDANGILYFWGKDIYMWVLLFLVVVSIVGLLVYAVKKKSFRSGCLGTVAWVLIVFVLFIAHVFGGVSYREFTEPETGRRFVAKVNSSLLKDSVKIYEQKGVFIIPCDAESFTVDGSVSGFNAYVSEDGQSIIIESPRGYLRAELPMDER